MAHNYERNQLFSSEGVVAVITGGGSGLGAMAAHALDANGAKAVYVLGRREDSLKKTASGGKNGSIKPIVCDVTSKDSLANAASIVRKEHGYVNLVFANSGKIGPNMAHLFADGAQPSVEQLQKELWESSMEQFTDTFHVNVTGVFYTAVAFLDLLDAANKKRPIPQTSQVIVTSSVAAFTRVPAAGFAYSQSKAAAVHMIKQLSTCLGSHKIRVNSIAPGLYPSEMTQSMPWMQSQDPRSEGSVDWQKVPLTRTGSEDDMGGLILFLASPAGSYINGAIMLTDGGRVGQYPAAY